MIDPAAATRNDAVSNHDGVADDGRAPLRWSIYLVLIALGVGNMLGRIAAVNSVDVIRLEAERIKARLAQDKKEFEARGLAGEQLDAALDERRRQLEVKLQLQRPFLSGNDRSRWCTIRSLVEHGTYEIDDVVHQPRWDTIDMVRHRGDDGQWHLYSSKPPLLPTMMAGVYWVLYHVFGLDLETNTYEVVRLLVIVVNVLPLVLMFILLAKYVERYARTDWARIVTMAVATFGTFLTTFAIVLNNHLPAAVCTMAALYAVARIWMDDRREWHYFAAAGAAAAFCAACELPALSLLAAVGIGLGYKAPRQTLAAFLPAAALVTVAFFATNYIAHDSWRPPYMHRSDTDPEDNWYHWSFERDGKTISSYWNEPRGIDVGEPSPGVYALHVLIGHHGIFSLTPIWILSVVGLGMMAAARERKWWAIALLIGGLSAVCIAFFLTRPQLDRNYGGMTSGFRWVFWLAPMWLAAMIPALDVTSRSRWLRILVAALLALSVVSASFPIWNPWTHPSLMRLFMHLGWAEAP